MNLINFNTLTHLSQENNDKKTTMRNGKFMKIAKNQGISSLKVSAFYKNLKK